MTTGLRALAVGVLPLLLGGWGLLPGSPSAPAPTNTETSMADAPAAQPAPEATPAAIVPDRVAPRVLPEIIVGPAPPPAAASPTAAPAPAAPVPPPEPEFGDRGELVLSGTLSASFGHLGYGATNATSTTVGIEPAFGYFVRDNLLVGASAFIRYEDSVSGIGVSSTTLTFGGYGRVGENVPLSTMFSWFPVGSLGIWNQRQSATAPSTGFITSVGGTAVSANSDITQKVVVFELFAPLLVHPSSHLFLGFGPDVYVDLYHTVDGFSNKRTFLGLSSLLGGWF